jgi:hypothetical protein
MTCSNFSFLFGFFFFYFLQTRMLLRFGSLCAEHPGSAGSDFGSSEREPGVSLLLVRSRMAGAFIPLGFSFSSRFINAFFFLL